jgi:hypothetical protein
LSETEWTTAGLWLAVVASGVYHGINPGMGWPLAVAAGLMQKNARALFTALGALWAGHLIAMLAMLLPFAALIALAAWQRPVQAAAAVLVTGFGLFRLARPRHPRVLARIPPAQLGLWSFAVAIAHGAGLMLLPIYLGLCERADLDAGHRAASALVGANLAIAMLVSVVHSAAMIAAGGALAWLVYRFLGLKFVAQSWFNLDTVWALSLVAVGGVALAFSLAG